jgi:hypothetical protein
MSADNFSRTINTMLYKLLTNSLKCISVRFLSTSSTQEPNNPISPSNDSDSIAFSSSYMNLQDPAVLLQIKKALTNVPPPPAGGRERCILFSK